MQATTYKNLSVRDVWNEKREPIIWFIRHGESEANVGMATTHTQDVRLTEVGLKQAEEIAHAFTRAPGLIIASPYRRAQETSEPTRLRFPDTRYEIWPEVREFTYLGSLHGVHSTRQDRHARASAFWKMSDPTHKDGEGESFTQFLCRVRKAIERLQQQDERFVVVFGHEQFMRAASWLLHGWTAETSAGMGLFRQVLSSSPLPNGFILKAHNSSFPYPALC